MRSWALLGCIVTTAVVTTAACRVPGVDVTGKQCPCPGGFTCDTATNTCTRGGPAGDARSDGPADAARDAPIDGNASSYRAAVIADSPVAYWRLGDQGSDAVDEMGHASGSYSGTCTHGVAGAIAGDPNTAVHFDGSSCKVAIADPTGVLAFTGVAPYSVEAWIDDAAVASGFRVVFSKESRNVGPVDGYALVDSAPGVYFERAVAGSAPTTAPASHANGSFVHLVGVFDGTAFVLYVDAVAGMAFSDTRSMPSSTAAGLIGADLDGDFFLGDLDEVAVYDHALTAAQIAAHYAIATGARD